MEEEVPHEPLEGHRLLSGCLRRHRRQRVLLSGAVAAFRRALFQHTAGVPARILTVCAILYDIYAAGLSWPAALQQHLALRQLQ